MALNWDFKTDKIGRLEVDYGHEKFSYNLYSGNALLIEIYETETQYQVCGFWCDKVHMNNCLGISKGYTNIYGNGEIKRTYYLDRNYRYTALIVQALAKAKFDENMEIEIHLCGSFKEES